MMTLHLPPELETRLRSEAAREGLDADAYIVRTLERAVSYCPSPAAMASLSQRESQLLQSVNIGLSEVEWRRYLDLKTKSDDENLTSDELREFIATSDRIERASAQRMPHLIELAALRHVSLEQLMDQLGLGNGREAGFGCDGN